MLVSDIMRGDVKTADAEDTFADVAKAMRANGISSVVVLERDGTLAGILTERDIVNLVAAGGDPHAVKVAHGMTRRHLETVELKTDIGEAADRMVSLNIRHLPVVDKGKVVGVALDPRPHEVGRRGAHRRPRDARHGALPEGAERRERAPEAAPDEQLARREGGEDVGQAPQVLRRRAGFLQLRGGRVVGRFAAQDPHGAHARRSRGAHVVVEAVADHHGAGGLDPGGPHGVAEQRRVGLLQTEVFGHPPHLEEPAPIRRARAPCGPVRAGSR